MRAARVLGPLLLVAVAACGPAAPAAARPAAGPSDESGRSRTFERLEEEILGDLAAIDRRLAMRARITPSDDDLRRVAMAAMLREDPTVAVVDGAIDPFSFDARGRGLETAKQKISSLPAIAETNRASERELLSRLVGAEIVRLEEERALPRSASALVRAIVDTWHPPKTERELAEHDHWLARRLSDLGEAMATSRPADALDVVRARELDDALDALEHLTSTPGFTATTQELVRLRDALEGTGSRPADKAPSDWSPVARRLRAELGVSAPAEDLARDLAALETNLRTRAEQAVAAANLGRDALAAALERNVFVAGLCIDAVPGSHVRSMAAPPEREPACHLRHLVARAEDDTARAIALAAMHDHVIVAEWALDVARGASTIASAQSGHRLLVPILPDTRARYERIALARPLAAIGAAETARILVEGDPKQRAAAWAVLGDVPLDIARKEL